MAADGRRARRWARRACFVGIGLCYALAIPWYRVATPGPLRLVAGVPDWVAVAVACYLLAAALNAAAWMLSDVRDAPHAQERP